MNKEYILCAAIWFDDGEEYVHQPKNISTGFVISGRRHHNCFMTLSITSGKNETHLHFEREQGFITNTDRFVDRVEALEIAISAGQTRKLSGKLYSEDLY